MGWPSPSCLPVAIASPSSCGRNMSLAGSKRRKWLVGNCEDLVSPRTVIGWDCAQVPSMSSACCVCVRRRGCDMVRRAHHCQCHLAQHCSGDCHCDRRNLLWATRLPVDPRSLGLSPWSVAVWSAAILKYPDWLCGRCGSRELVSGVHRVQRIRCWVCEWMVETVSTSRLRVVRGW